jgi:hypothetical protein
MHPEFGQEHTVSCSYSLSMWKILQSDRVVGDAAERRRSRSPPQLQPFTDVTAIALTA